MLVGAAVAVGVGVWVTRQNPSSPSTSTTATTTTSGTQATSTKPTTTTLPKNPIVTVGTATIKVELANTTELQEKGLSGRTGLAKDTGMLFVFAEPGEYGFWMKDMKFAIDIIFIDANRKVVRIHRNVPPESYLSNPPQAFYADTPVLMVLEVAAGYAAAHNIVEGSTVSLK